MEIDTDAIYRLLATDDSDDMFSIISSVIKDEIQSKKEWEELVTILEVGCKEIYQKHWLKTHHVMLSLFGMPELLGVDCSLFDELRTLEAPKTMEQASSGLFSTLSEVARKQFENGGSTLFFDVKQVASTQSAILVPDLIEARFRESIHILNEIDDQLPLLTKEWVDVSRLWRTGNGFRLLKARKLGIHIHLKEYKEVRNQLALELNVDPSYVKETSYRLKEEGKVVYIQLSRTLDEFVTGLIASRGIRGIFEPHYKTWINHEGLDEF
ncbi:MAG: hypothetical protein ACFFE2_14140 [Candidatus Thorarchaeota archaeon]